MPYATKFDKKEWSRRYNKRLDVRARKAISKRKWYLRNLEKIQAYMVLYRQKNRNTLIERRNRKRKQARIDALNKYGGSCACCGETQFEFLAFEHRNNDGGKERASGLKDYSFILSLLASSIRDDIEVLCHNCNSSKAYYGYCPHQCHN